MNMEDTQDDPGPSEQRSPSATWWHSDFAENFGSISLESKDENLGNKEFNNKEKYDSLSYKSASQILWSTGMLSGPIPNGFYSVVPDKKLKELYEDIPTLEELHALELEGLRADVILVDAEKDRKLNMLKQLIVALVKGLNANTAAMIKKIARLVSDFYKRPSSELSPKKAAQEETSHVSENRGVQMLGQIRHGACRPRAILFKVLADTVRLESRLVVGLPTEGASECVDSHKHMSVLVVLNSVELMVDLMRFPGQLIPRSTKAIFMTHISAAGESDSAENDSCDSPMEPNSPLYGVSERVDPESAEKEDGLLYQHRLEASANVAGPSLRNMMLRSNSVDRKLSLSHSEPNIAATFWRRSRRKVIAEQRTASSSPEHPSLRARGRSMLSSDNKSFRDYSDHIAASSRSEGASTSETRRIRRRSISMTPEIGDDIATDNQHDDHDKLSSGRAAFCAPLRQHSSQKAMSLPSSPQEFRSQTPEQSGTPRVNEEMVSAWNRVLGSPLFQKKPLLPFEEWNIDFSELIVGTRVGIGFFGEVFRGVWNGTDVAIKVFLEQDLTAENMEDFCNEISILSRLRHPNVILFLGACTTPPRLSMITEYMEMGSLYYLIHLSGQKKKLSWRRRIKMLRDICRGLMCIHRMKIIHRDLKSANCLVNKHWTVKICDFGLSRIMV
ncbi:Non-specific serine/threonine protein kinase [Handroanthus impetiginosus]|uniref:non-specific serine/threonine protein kinase n=1 Tax=Handroanthus impetiginosus TaxID=429701 RepID=A0A2G9GBB4_9LAMI|nr:Non-specific serine/threonine protein kinase [Handroanthus impetiginosus]